MGNEFRNKGYISIVDSAVAVGAQASAANSVPGSRPVAAEGEGGRPEHTSAPDRRSADTARMGFAVDIVGYSARNPPQRRQLQQRIDALGRAVLADTKVRLADTDHQGTGDGMVMFLPADVRLHETLPVLLRSWRGRLRDDNQLFRDRMRVRLAAVFGLVGVVGTDFTGSAIIEASRLLDSSTLRTAISENPETDFAALVADLLYGYVVGEGYPGLDAAEFRRTEVRVKTFSANAWLWAPQ